jgi:spore coat protein CotH
MQIKLVLTLDEVEKAIKQYVNACLKIDGYTVSEIDFIYEGEDSDNCTPIEGALILLNSQSPRTSTPPATYNVNNDE